MGDISAIGFWAETFEGDRGLHKAVMGDCLQSFNNLRHPPRHVCTIPGINTRDLSKNDMDDF